MPVHEAEKTSRQTGKYKKVCTDGWRTLATKPTNAVIDLAA